MDFFISPAWAQGAGGQPNSIIGFLPFIAIFVLFYFLLIRPQQKRQKEHRQMIDALAKGNEIITGGGLLGQVTEVGEQFLTVQIAQGVTVKVQKHTVANVLPKDTVKNV